MGINEDIIVLAVPTLLAALSLGALACLAQPAPKPVRIKARVAKPRIR